MASPQPALTQSVGVSIALLVLIVVYAPAGLGEVERVWAAAALLGLGFVLGQALVDISSVAGRGGVVPLGLLVVLGGMYLCVPETNQFVMAALLPAGVLGVELVRREQMGLEWYAAAAASVAWAGMFGSAGRQSALMGAIFAWWPVLLPAIVRHLTEVRTRTAVLVPMAFGSAASLTFARSGGISDTAGAAIPVVLGLAGVSGVGSWVIVRRLPPSSAPR